VAEAADAAAGAGEALGYSPSTGGYGSASTNGGGSVPERPEDRRRRGLVDKIIDAHEWLIEHFVVARVMSDEGRNGPKRRIDLVRGR
jgi:hypothetical protein